MDWFELDRIGSDCIASIGFDLYWDAGWYAQILLPKKLFDPGFTLNHVFYQPHFHMQQIYLVLIVPIQVLHPAIGFHFQIPELTFLVLQLTEYSFG